MKSHHSHPLKTVARQSNSFPIDLSKATDKTPLGLTGTQTAGISFTVRAGDYHASGKDEPKDGFRVAARVTVNAGTLIPSGTNTHAGAFLYALDCGFEVDGSPDPAKTALIVSVPISPVGRVQLLDTKQDRSEVDSYYNITTTEKTSGTSHVQVVPTWETWNLSSPGDSPLSARWKAWQRTPFSLKDARTKLIKGDVIPQLPGPSEATLTFGVNANWEGDLSVLSMNFVVETRFAAVSTDADPAIWETSTPKYSAKVR